MHSKGFTIIEVMLFLAVGGALTVAVLATAGVAINQQRYRDAVNTLQTAVKQQYNEVAHVINDRVDAKRCDGAASVTDAAVATAEPRGTSECVILGRHIVLNGATFSAVNIVGHLKTGEKLDPTDGDLAALKKYNISPDASSTYTSQFAWDTRINNATAMVIARSPVSGSIVTLTANGAAAPTAIISTGSTDARTICLDPNGILVPSTLGIRIKARAASPSAVEMLSDGACT